MLLLRLLWRGEIDLPVTFWGGCIGLNLIVIDNIGIPIVARIGSPFHLRFYTALVLVFNFFILPALWRSARYWQGDRIWSILARLCCLLFAARVVYTFVSRWNYLSPH